MFSPRGAQKRYSYSPSPAPIPPVQWPPKIWPLYVHPCMDSLVCLRESETVPRTPSESPPPPPQKDLMWCKLERRRSEMRVIAPHNGCSALRCGAVLVSVCLSYSKRTFTIFMHVRPDPSARDRFREFGVQWMSRNSNMLHSSVGRILEYNLNVVT